MGDKIITEIETILKNFDEKKPTNKLANESEYKERIKGLKNDLCSNGKHKEKEALQLLQNLLECNVQNIHEDVLSILEDDKIEKRLKISILDSITKYLINLITSNNSAELMVLYETWKRYGLDKFQQMLSSIVQFQDNGCINYVDYLIEDILPAIMYCETNNIRQVLTEIATLFIEVYPLSRLKPNEYDIFLTKLPSVFNKTTDLQKRGTEVERDVLHLLLKYLDQKFTNPEIQEIFNNASIDWGALQNHLENNLNIECLKYISDNNFNDLTKVYLDWKSMDTQKFSDALKDLCLGTDSGVKCKEFVLNTVIPTIMSTTNVNDSLRIARIDLALEFASVLPINSLDEAEYSSLLNNINDYIVNISDLRDSQFGSWQKLWMFLVRLLGKKLHQSMSLINRLLRVLEDAFRNSTCEQRLKGYDCWKELIDNVGLDIKHLSTEKQIRLLLTPLRAKFSRQEQLIVKRFDVFIYLIEKLQSKAVLVLKEFMEFCFGEVSEDTDPHKAGQGKNFSGLWLRSAKVLMAFIGHHHEDNEQCLDIASEISLKSPILDENNVSNFCPVIINSVVECCFLLKDLEMSQQRHTVIKCFWNSLLHTFTKVANEEQKQKCMDSLYKSFEKLLKDNDPYCNSIAVILFKCIINLDQDDAAYVALNNLNPMLKIIFSVPLGPEGCIKTEKFQALWGVKISKEQREKIQNSVIESFIKYKTIEGNADYVASLWIKLVGTLEDSFKGKLMDVLVWPAIYMHQITDSAREALVYDNYKQVVSKFVEKSTELHVGLFKSFEKNLRNNPLLVKNILTLLRMFSPNVKNKDSCCGTLELLHFILVTPFTEETNFKYESVESYIKSIYDLNISEVQDNDLIKKLCLCFEDLLRAKRFNILPSVLKALETLPENILSIHTKYLNLSFFIDLSEAETDIQNTENIKKIIDKMRKAKVPDNKKDLKQFMPIGGRSAKIADLVKQIPQSPVKNMNSPSTLRLFGKNIETMSPLTVKGSHLKDITMKPPTSTKVEKKPKKSFAIDDESNSKFVLIDSEVKLKPEALTEHQKETLKKRREDIPALYQDLSQSLSESLDSNSVSNSAKIEETTVVKASNENTEPPSEQDKVINEDAKSIFEVVNCFDKPEEGNEGKVSAPIELKNLVMNIVGAEEFVSAGERKKRREKKAEDEEQEAKTDLTTTEDVNSQVSDAEKKNLPVSVQSTENNEIYETPVKEQNSIDVPDQDVTPPKEETANVSSGESTPSPKRRGRPPKNKKVTDAAPTVPNFESKMKNDPADGKDSLKVIISITPPVGKRKPGRPPGKPSSGQVTRRRKITPESIRKSTRKSIPTEKYSQMVKEPSESAPSQVPETPQVIPSQDPEEEAPLANILKLASIEKKAPVKRGRKRKRPSIEIESEDCIESSQDSSYSRFITSMRKSFSKNDNLAEKQGTDDDVDTSKKSDIVDLSEELFHDDESHQPANPVPKTKRKRSNTPELVEKLRSSNEFKKITPERLLNKDKTKTPPRREIINKHVDEIIEKVASSKRAGRKKKHQEQQKSGSNASPDSVVSSTTNSEKAVPPSTQSQDTQTQETESAEVGSDNCQLQLDLPQKPDLNDSDKAIAQMDTASLPLGSLSDLHDGITDDNKTLTNKSEMAESTVIEAGEEDEDPSGKNGDDEEMVDVDHHSPTKLIDTSDIPSSPVTGDTPIRNTELLNNTVDISPIALGQNNQNEVLDDLNDLPPKLVPVALKFDSEDVEHENSKEKSPEKADDAPDKAGKSDVEKQNFEKAMPNRDNITRRSKKLLGPHSLIGRRRVLKTMSPSASRIKKLMSNVKVPSDGDSITAVNEEDILTFSREVPSPLALPRSSILKRKHSETPEESFSPCAKRKRVNFSDPCTTSKKIFIKDDNTTENTFSFASEEEIDKQFLEVLTGSAVPDSETVHTEQSLQLNNVLLLRDDRPIYPELVNCTNDIGVVIRKLTGPMFVAALLTKLKNKGISTVGDLANKSESEISKFPFKSPVVTNVYKVLDKYYVKNWKNVDNLEGRTDGDENGDNNDADKVDVEEKIVEVVNKARNAGTTSQTICALVYPLLDQNEVETFSKLYFKPDTKEVPEVARELPVASSSTEESSQIQESSSQIDNDEEHLRAIIDRWTNTRPRQLMQLTIEILQKLQQQF